MRGSGGNDIIKGSATGYDQMDYEGSLSDYLFSENAGGTVSVTKDGGSHTDTLSNFDGVWFIGAAQYYALEDIIDTTVVDEGDLI